MFKIVIRKARQEDVPKIVALINRGGPDDKPREVLPDILPESYYTAFERIARDQNAFLMVAESADQIVGTFQLNFLTYLAAKGREDAQLEAVHVEKEFRGRGIGSQMIDWAIEQARARRCRRIQLTTDKRRIRSHRFYENLGVVPSHEGMKRAFE